MNDKMFVEQLKQRILIEFRKQDRSGVYGFTQRSMAYNSNRIEGSTLTEDQTASLFDTGTFYSDNSDDIFRAKDVEEMNGHFKMFNYMLKHIGEPLSAEIIKGMHKNLKEGVFEDLANGYAVGDWKKRKNVVGNVVTALPQEVPDRIRSLLEMYNSKDNITIKDIAEFHVSFETIHPFQDGNGRVGRMIILKQCLDSNIMPIVIRDSKKAQYYRALNKAHNENDYSLLIEFFKQEQEYYKKNIVPMVIESTELSSMKMF